MNIDWANGGSTIAGPGSGYVTSPVWDEDLILYGDLDAALIKAVKMVFDTLGHYSRYDVATLAVREDHWVPSVCLKDVAPRGLARFSHQEMKRITASSALIFPLSNSYQPTGFFESISRVSPARLSEV